MSTQRPWLASYPRGVPASIDVNAYRSIAHVLESACERFHHRPAFSNMGRVLTYADIDRQSRAFASYLRNVLKLNKGDRVAIMLPNVLQYPIAIFGVLRAGLTVVNTNPMYTARELRHQLHDAGASAIVVLDNFASVLAEVLHDTPCKHIITRAWAICSDFQSPPVVNLMLRHVKKMVPPYSIPHAVRFGAALAAGARQAPPSVEIGHDDIAFLQYTGGTTGVAKGAMLSHGNMVANMQQSSAWLGTNVREGRRDHHHGDSAVPHLRADGELPGLHEIRRPQLPDNESPRHAGIRQDVARRPLYRDYRRQHAVQRAVEHPGIRQGRFFHFAPVSWRRHGRAARGCRALEEGDRRDAGGGLWADRDFPGRMHESPGPHRLTTVRSACRFHRPTPRSRTTMATRWASARSASCA
jgi:hypothetical protein